MSSSILTTGNAPAQRVPAWKRLGLKLKSAGDGPSQDATSQDKGAPSAAPSLNNHVAGSGVSNAKRKSSSVPALEQSAKRPKQDISQSQTPRKPKSVSFTAEVTGSGPPAKANEGGITTKKKQPGTKKATSSPKKPVKTVKQAPVNLEPALAYLRQWHSSRESWKFNKNHQTRLLEQVFADEYTIPAVDINIFYEYIRALQGGVRSRLKQLASGVKAQDMEQGPGGFEGGKEMTEKKQKDYEEVIKTFLGQSRTPEKRRFNEVDYVLRTTDMEMQRRVVKRMRCEMVLDELSDSDSLESTSTTTTTTSTSTEKGPSASGAENAIGEADGDKRLKLNDGSQQRVKRKRKLRTAAVEDETSSDSESDSESDSDSNSNASSSSSSSEESSDEDEEMVPRPGETEDTSSSSSSSSSESESDSDELNDD
ncbi:hypothetical protein F5Y15DRAFT_354937 [Xylariaceae sp. FL0016]|nr:hypothetical protein F5Y15DRAFT_354937 [Xylariaceae sp. FL0016]